MTEVVDSEAARAEEALAFVVSVVKNAAENTKDRLAAAKTLLEWSKAKPASKSDVTVKSALDWLDEVGE